MDKLKYGKRIMNQSSSEVSFLVAMPMTLGKSFKVIWPSAFLLRVFSMRDILPCLAHWVHWFFFLFWFQINTEHRFNRYCFLVCLWPLGNQRTSICRTSWNLCLRNIWMTHWEVSIGWRFQFGQVHFCREYFLWGTFGHVWPAGWAEQLGDSVKLGHSVKRVSSAFERTPNPSSFFLSCC